jgi:hypothetical protein
MNIPRNEDFRGEPINNPKEIPSNEPSVEELSSLLRHLSKMLELANSQNPKLSYAVGKLANILLRYKDKSIDDVLDGLTLAKRLKSVKHIAEAKISESEAKSFTLEQIEKLLETKELGKSDLITIAASRFGMSKADLMKTRKEYIIEGIKTAITNLRTIDIIGKQASGR